MSIVSDMLNDKLVKALRALLKVYEITTRHWDDQDDFKMNQWECEEIDRLLVQIIEFMRTHRAFKKKKSLAN